MHLYENPRALETLWRRQMEMALEAGETPALSLGWESLHPDSLWSLLILNGVARQRPGAIDGWVVSGGEGAYWLLGSEIWGKGRRGGLVYGGNDSTTFAASLTLAETPGAGRGRASLPAGMGWMLTATAVLGAERAEGEHLPFVLAQEDVYPLYSAPDASESRAGDWLGQLEGWSVALLAMGLLLAALLL